AGRGGRPLWSGSLPGAGSRGGRPGTRAGSPSRPRVLVPGPAESQRVRNGGLIMMILTRRDFLDRCCSGLGGVALSALLGESLAAQERKITPIDPLAERLPAIAPKAKRVIFLFQYGGPSQ